MLTTLGMVLLGFAGFSAAFLLFVFLFGDKGTFLNLAKVGTTSAPWPIASFPYTVPSAGITLASADKLDLELTTMGMIFIYGGTIAALLSAVMMFVSPWCALNKCKVCAACTAQEPLVPACGTGCSA